MFPLWKKPYRKASQTDLNALRKWNEDLARGLQRREERCEGVVGTVIQQNVAQLNARNRQGSDIGKGHVQDRVEVVVPEDWKDETWLQAWKSGIFFSLGDEMEGSMS